LTASIPSSGAANDPAEAGSGDGVDVSVIVVSWNVREFLRRCLESIESSREDVSAEILVIDNASTDGSAEMIREEFEDVRLIASDSNLGYGPGNNLGVAHASGRYVFFLNPDTVLRTGALRQLIEFLDRHSTFAMVGPRLVGPNGAVQRICARTLPTVTLTLFGALYLHRLPYVGRRLNDRLLSPYDLDRSQEVDAISGAAMLGRKETIEKLHGFDETFLYTAEDIDLCRRLRQSGARIFYLADAEVVHFGGQSSALASVRTGTMSIISTHEYFQRWEGSLHAAVYRLIVKTIQMPLLLLVGVGKSVSRRDLDPLRERLRLARAVWAWRVDD
jgi:GT2 family glycosyltransferase